MALAIAVYWCVSKGLGFYILTTGFVGTIANQFMKLCFRIPRPWVLDPDFTIVESARAGATGYSFPSGHTQNAFSSFGCLGMWTKKGWRVLFFAIVVLIGFSRMYLGRAHAARRGRGLPAGARPHAGALPALPRHRGASAQDVRPSSPAWSP